MSNIGEFQFSNSLVICNKFGSSAEDNIQKSMFHLLHELKKNEKSNESNIKCKFPIFLEKIRKKIKVSPRPLFKNANFESEDELKNTASQFEFHC